MTVDSPSLSDLIDTLTYDPLELAFREFGISLPEDGMNGEVSQLVKEKSSCFDSVENPLSLVFREKALDAVLYNLSCTRIQPGVHGMLDFKHEEVDIAEKMVNHLHFPNDYLPLLKYYEQRAKVEFEKYKVLEVSNLIVLDSSNLEGSPYALREEATFGAEEIVFVYLDKDLSISKEVDLDSLRAWIADELAADLETAFTEVVSCIKKVTSYGFWIDYFGINPMDSTVVEDTFSYLGSALASNFNDEW